MKSVLRMLKLKRKDDDLTLLCLFSCIGYKKSWYDKFGKTTKMRSELFHDDFAIIENIIESTGEDENEQYSFASMFTSSILKVQQQYFPTESLEDYPANNSKDVRNGLRTILFIILQMCTIAYSCNSEHDLKEFWKAMSDHYVNNDCGKDWPLCIYGQVFHNIMTLTVGFQNEPVSIKRNEYWKC